jgi:hypothetical protein
VATVVRNFQSLNQKHAFKTLKLSLLDRYTPKHTERILASLPRDLSVALSQVAHCTTLAHFLKSQICKQVPKIELPRQAAAAVLCPPPCSPKAAGANKPPASGEEDELGEDFWLGVQYCRWHCRFRPLSAMKNRQTQNKMQFVSSGGESRSAQLKAFAYTRVMTYLDPFPHSAATSASATTPTPAPSPAPPPTPPSPPSPASPTPTSAPGWRRGTCRSSRRRTGSASSPTTSSASAARSPPATSASRRRGVLHGWCRGRRGGGWTRGADLLR